MRPFLTLLVGGLVFAIACASGDPTPEQMLPDALPTKDDVRAAYGIADDVKVVQTSDRYLPNDHLVGRFGGLGDRPTPEELEAAGRVNGYVGAYNLYSPSSAHRVTVTLSLYTDDESASRAVTGVLGQHTQPFEVPDMGDEAVGWPTIIADTNDGGKQFLCPCELTVRVAHVVASISIFEHITTYYEGMSPVQESIAQVVAARILDEFGNSDTLS